MRRLGNAILNHFFWNQGWYWWYDPIKATTCLKKRRQRNWNLVSNKLLFPNVLRNKNKTTTNTSSHTFWAAGRQHFFAEHWFVRKDLRNFTVTQVVTSRVTSSGWWGDFVPVPPLWLQSYNAMALTLHIRQHGMDKKLHPQIHESKHKRLFLLGDPPPPNPNGPTHANKYQQPVWSWIPCQPSRKSLTGGVAELPYKDFQAIQARYLGGRWTIGSTLSIETPMLTIQLWERPSSRCVKIFIPIDSQGLCWYVCSWYRGKLTNVCVLWWLGVGGMDMIQLEKYGWNINTW